ncbi:hypothetical protein ACWX0K_24060 (plasmid) [Nitrobacteraceae bacterium UC4446_H13]
MTATRNECGLRLDYATPMDKTLSMLRGRAVWARNFKTVRSAAATFPTLPGKSVLVNGGAMALDTRLHPSRMPPITQDGDLRTRIIEFPAEAIR